MDAKKVIDTKEYGLNRDADQVSKKICEYYRDVLIDMDLEIRKNIKKQQEQGEQYETLNFE